MSIKSRRKIAIIHPLFLWGGAEIVFLAMIKTLSQNYDVTVYSSINLFKNSDRIYEYYLIDIRNLIFKNKVIGYDYFQRFKYLYYNLTIKKVKSDKNKYDLLISSNGFFDFGMKGIQYIHFPPKRSNYLSQADNHPNIWKIYKKVAQKISNFNNECKYNNITLANSKWTAFYLLQDYGIKAKVIFPPVIHKAEIGKPDLNNLLIDKPKFIIFGRISPEKNILNGIDIISKLVSKGIFVELVIAGYVSNLDYLKQIQKVISNLNWIKIVINPSKMLLQSLLNDSSYVLVPAINEHFGITTVEAAINGKIVFGHNSGGTAEILNGFDELLFSSNDEALSKILKILKSSVSYKRDIIEKLKNKMNIYSYQNFKRNIINVVDEYFNE
jgi:glycosyltransferase involved in cell wall biosynthesis